ncbi:MAG: TM2 domain-containing protein [Cryomorphaceae bacterium]|nr:TM2 domain-containing protein [Cryomorphaceae bacterium]
MEQNKVDSYLMANAKYFASDQIPAVRDHLLRLPDDRMVQLQSLGLKDPTTILIVSLLAGGLGVDRFMLGETGLGIAKLLTCGGLGVWTIVDWFIIMGKTKENNLAKIGALS